MALTPPPGLPVPAQVAEVLQGLFQELPSIIFKNTLQTVMQAVSVLGTQHTQETVEVILSLCHPSERYGTGTHDPEVNTHPSSVVCPLRPQNPWAGSGMHDTGPSSERDSTLLPRLPNHGQGVPRGVLG